MEAISEKRKSRKTENNPSNIGIFNAKKKNIYQMLPNIVRILSIILTTSATSASVERANLALCYIKTDFWSTMSVRCYCCMFTGTLN